VQGELAAAVVEAIRAGPRAGDGRTTARTMPATMPILIDPRAAPSPEDRLAVFDHRPEVPAIHHAAVRLARRLVGLVEPGLPGTEAPARALTEF
jgi:hypothetical protein